MAQGQAQGFDALLQEFMVDLNGDGVPDVAVPRDAVPERVQTAQIGGAATIPRWFKALVGGGAVAGGATVADRMIRGDGAPPQVVPAEPPPPFTAGAPTNSQFVNYLMQPRADDFPQPKRGGVLDTLNLPPPGQPDEPRNVLLDGLNKAAGVGDYLLGGLPSSVAGLLPWNTMGEVKASARDAQRSAAGTPLGRDLMAMPQAFAGGGPGAVQGMGAAPVAAGRGPQRLLSEDAATRFNRDLDAGNRQLDLARQQRWAQRDRELAQYNQRAQSLADQSAAAKDAGSRALPPPLIGPQPNQPPMVPQGAGMVQPGNDPATLAAAREASVVQAAQQRAAIQAREALQKQQQAPLMARQDMTSSVDERISKLIADKPAFVTRANTIKLLEDVTEITGAQPWQVLRAMHDKGYDLSGLVRSSFQTRNEMGQLKKMDAEQRALWDMVRRDTDPTFGLYRQRNKQYEPAPSNPLIPPRRPGGGGEVD